MYTTQSIFMRWSVLFCVYENVNIWFRVGNVKSHGVFYVQFISTRIFFFFLYVIIEKKVISHKRVGTERIRNYRACVDNAEYQLKRIVLSRYTPKNKIKIKKTIFNVVVPARFGGKYYFLFGLD